MNVLIEKKINILWGVIIIWQLVYNIACAQSPDISSDDLVIKLDPDLTYQTIHNFGASDAWSTQFVGKYWSEDARKGMAKLLFSKEFNANGNPEGIGLTAWRFNIGAGSAEQGKESGIHDDWRKSECFLNQDGTYNWDKQSGQLWFLEQAKFYGVDNFIGFVNSPPVFFTENNKAWSDNGDYSNLLRNNYNKYAHFLSEVVKGVQNITEVEFDYISPFNEPQWDWGCCNQEGSPWTNNEIVEVVKELDNAFLIHNVSSKIEIAEAAKINYLYSKADKPNRGNQIEYFFDKKSPGYLGGLPSIGNKIAGHSYFTTWNNQTLVHTRQNLRSKIEEIGDSFEYWMTEYCIYEDNSEIVGQGRDLGIDSALYMAKVIHSDLVLANASAWHWWLAISPYNYKDGLIYIDKNKHGGQFYESKMLWALGHYSRFIKPGMVRINTSNMNMELKEPSIAGVLHSAYKSDNEIVVVLVNQLKKDKNIKILGIPKDFSLKNIYETTSKTEINLHSIELQYNKGAVYLQKRSLLTCVFQKEKM